MGVIYKPFGIILSLIAAQLGKKVFDFVWTKIDDEEPPRRPRWRPHGAGCSPSRPCRA